jgi:hypothetical protein
MVLGVLLSSPPTWMSIDPSTFFAAVRLLID